MEERNTKQGIWRKKTNRSTGKVLCLSVFSHELYDDYTMNQKCFKYISPFVAMIYYKPVNVYIGNIENWI